MTQQTIPKATAIKRILAFGYDLLLIIPLMMLVALIWLPFNQGLAIEPGNPLRPYMIATCTILTPMIFYAYFWYKGGQTLGMRSWRLRVVTTNGTALTKKQSAIRSVSLILSLAIIVIGIETAATLKFTSQAMPPIALAVAALYGLALAFFPKRVSLIDQLTHTRVVQLPKKK